MTSSAPGLLLAFLCLAVGTATDLASEEPGSFGFAQVESALRYFATGDEQDLRSMAESRATAHLLAHSERTGYYPAGTSALDLSRDLVKHPEPEEWRLAKVESLVGYVKARGERQVKCMGEAKKYLPDSVRLTDPLHLTWGYDIGVAIDGSASLNLAHDHFLEDPEEVWFFCIHEMHHAGVMSLHSMVEIGGITTTKQLFDFVRYATFLEGTATYAAYEARALAEALEGDGDYVALTDRARMDRYRADYFEIYEQMESAPERMIGDSDWQAIESLSEGDRLWYRVGAEMAAAIDERFGRERLKEIVAEGPSAFFSAYFASQ
jgi:hypothetical protein